MVEPRKFSRASSDAAETRFETSRSLRRSPATPRADNDNAPGFAIRSVARLIIGMIAILVAAFVLVRLMA